MTALQDVRVPGNVNPAYGLDTILSVIGNRLPGAESYAHPRADFDALSAADAAAIRHLADIDPDYLVRVGGSDPAIADKGKKN